jgi:hypothetical protein
MQAEAFRRILFKLQQKLMTYCIQEADNSQYVLYQVIDIWLSILMYQSLTMPGVLSLSHLLLSLPLLLSYL